MFYIETEKGINDIITNYYLDTSPGIDACTLKNIPQKTLNKLAKFISGVTKTINPLCLKSIYLPNKTFLTAINMNDIKIIKSEMSTYKSDKQRAEFKRDFDRLSKCYPNKLVETANAKIRKLPVVYRNDRDSILYLSDIVSLDKEIELVGKSKVLDKKQMQRLYSITIRLILPEYLAHKIDCANKEIIPCEIAFNGTKMYCFKEFTIENCPVSDFVETINKYTKADDLAPRATMCKMYINVTFEELSDIINNTAKYESDYIQQVIGAIYYNLYRFSNIRELFSIDENVERDITKRIHMRRGN